MASFASIDKKFNNRFVDIAPTDKVDLYIQGVFTQSFEGQMSLGTGSPSAKISGMIKLAQQYLITLLTIPGSDIFEPARGTSLASLIGGNFSNMEELKLIVRESVHTAGSQVMAQQSVDRPEAADETLKSVELVRLIINNADSISPSIGILSEAGQFANVKLPGLRVSNI